MMERRPCRVHAALLCVACCLLCAREALAQGEEARVEGVIVSVRADVIQVRPRFSTQLTRVLVDEKTQVQKGEMIGLDKLEPGAFLFGVGDFDEKGNLTPRFLQVVEERTGFFGGKIRGARGTGYGRSAFFGGKVKSAKPLVLIDDDGQELAVTLGPFVPLMRQGKVSRDALLVGQAIGAEGKKTTDGLLRAQEIQIQQLPGDGGGAVFGRVVAVQGGTIEVRPRFGDASVQATLAENATLQRQITIDVDSVKIGDELTAQGRLDQGTTSAPTSMIASVLLRGKQTYPKANSGGFVAMMRGGGRGDVTCTGTVASLSPLVITLESGSVTVTVPGQVPLVDLQPMTLADVKPGDKILLLGSEGKEGGMVAKTVILGASPIVGFGG